MAYDFHYTPTGTGVISGKEVLEQTEDAINDLGDQISGDVQTAIDTANNALNTANTASVDAQNAVNTASTAYTAATNAQNTANTAQNTASNALTAAQNAQNDVNALGNRVTTAEGNITQNTNAITGLTTRMGTAESNITNLQTAVSTAQATANSAQQTATTARQQSYVFRYSSTAVVPNSTIAYSTIDNTDNIKSGDKILDVDGKLFEITAVDTTNQTVTVGTALIDLAQDSDVVHKSGDETVGGNKEFTGTTTAHDVIPSAIDTYNLGSPSYQWNNAYIKSLTINGVACGDILTHNVSEFVDVSSNQTIGGEKTFISLYTQSGGPSLWMKNTSFTMGTAPTTNRYSGIWVQDNNGTDTAHIVHQANKNNSQNLRFSVSNTDGTNVYQNALTFQGRIDGTFNFYSDNPANLGTSTNKWKTINGVEPSSLSLPSGNLNDVIDISSYIVNLDGTTNSYTAPANGWISIAVTGTAIAIVSSSWSDSRLRASSGNVRMLYPVLKNETLDISVTGTTLDYARFIPCQGNV